MPSREAKNTRISEELRGSAGLARHFPALGILTQRMHRSRGQIELFAGNDDQALKGGTGHGAGGGVHASGQGLRGVVITAARVGEDQQRVAMESPVAAQFAVHGGGQGHDPVLVSLAVADEELVFGAFNVVDGQPEAFAQAQPATVDEFERSAVAAQADVGQQIVDLLAGEHFGQGVMVLGADLREQAPVGMAEKVDKEHTGGGASLADGLGLPMLLEFYEEEVLAKLRLGEGGRIAAEVLVNQPDLAVVGVPGAVGIVAQGQVIGERGHGRVRMVVVDRVGIVPRGGTDQGNGLGRPGSRVAVVAVACLY